MRKFYIVLIVMSALLFSCENIENVSESPDLVNVSLRINGCMQSKADSPLIPDVENLIYDVWVVQYDNMGLLIDAGTGHYRADILSGNLTATVTATLATGVGNTICVLANLDRGLTEPTRVWPQTLDEFKTSVNVIDLSDDITAANAGTLEDMPMSGYWEGEISSSSKNIQVSLGRMFARINLNIVNNSSNVCYLTSLSNVSTKVFAFPSVIHDPLPDDAYATLEINETVDSGKTGEFYFYTAPNFTDSADNATILNVNGKNVILSNGSPADANRDYNLYHNSNYTFTFNVN